MDSAQSPFEGLSFLQAHQGRIEFCAILGCAILFFTTIELVRRNRLKERYSFLWLITSGVLMLFAIKRQWLEDFARLVGVAYPPSALFLLLVFFMLLILLHFSTIISRLLHDKQDLAQHIGVLEARVRELENSRKLNLNETPTS